MRLEKRRNGRLPKRSEFAPNKRIVILAAVVMQGTTHAESWVSPNLSSNGAATAEVVGVALVISQYLFVLHVDWFRYPYQKGTPKLSERNYIIDLMSVMQQYRAERGARTKQLSQALAVTRSSGSASSLAGVACCSLVDGTRSIFSEFSLSCVSLTGTSVVVVAPMAGLGSH